VYFITESFNVIRGEAEGAGPALDFHQLRPPQLDMRTMRCMASRQPPAPGSAAAQGTGQGPLCWGRQRHCVAGQGALAPDWHTLRANRRRNAIKGAPETSSYGRTLCWCAPPLSVLRCASALSGSVCWFGQARVGGACVVVHPAVMDPSPHSICEARRRL